MKRVFVLGVVHDLARRELLSDVAVELALIGVQAAFPVDVLPDDLDDMLQMGGRHIESPGFAATRACGEEIATVVGSSAGVALGGDDEQILGA